MNKKISSFTVNHEVLFPGLYVSRQDRFNNEWFTTLDLRMTIPNKDEVMETSGIHTLEHLGATYLRNNIKFGEKILYFGPMGCRTGFYLIVFGKYESIDLLEIVKEMFYFITKFSGKIPGVSSIECGNYLDHDLGKAKQYALNYLNILNNIKPQNLKYIK